MRSKWIPGPPFLGPNAPPRASILRSRWRPGGPSETPRAYFGGLGGDVGAPGGFSEALGEHFGALGAVSGSLGSAPGTVLEPLWAVFLVDCGVSFFACGDSQNLALFWSFSKLVVVFSGLFKMAEIAPDLQFPMNLQLCLAFELSIFSGALAKRCRKNVGF